MGYRIDEIDKHILYSLSVDARNTTATTIAEEADVSPGTIRNRIDQMEDHGILAGYRAEIDYEQIGGRMQNLFVCTVPVTDREQAAAQALTVSGVTEVRELQAGQRNVHVVAVGSDTDELSRIGNDLAERGLTIEAEHLVQESHTHPYHAFDPTDSQREVALADFVSLTGGAEVMEISISEKLSVAGRTVAAANEAGLFDDEVLVVGIERDGEVVTPDGETTFRVGDVVTLFSREPLARDRIRGFRP
jgi:DNA-binding Lrp family transcriptional regulator